MGIGRIFVRSHRVLLVALLAGGLLLTSLTQPLAAAAAGKTTITFWDTNPGPARTPVYQTIINKFEKANPNISVQYVGIPEADYIQKIEAAIAAGNEPDVANPGVAQTSDFAAEGGLMNLNKLYSSWKLKNQISPNVLDLVKSVAPAGQLYGIPYTLNTSVLYYRADWFQQAGLQPPATWPEFYKDASTLTKPDQQQYGFGLRGASGSVSQLETWLFSESGTTTYFNKKGKSVMNSPAMLAALKKQIAIYGKDTSKGDINSGDAGTPMVQEYETGHAAMIQHNLGSYGMDLTSMPSGSIGVTVLPKSDVTGKQILQLSALDDVIFKDTTHLSAAWKFVQYLSEPYADGYWNSTSGQIPANSVAGKTATASGNLAINAAEKALSSKNTIVVNTPIYLPDYSPDQTQLEPEYQKVLLGQESPQTFLNHWASLMTTAQAQYEKAHPTKKSKKK